MTIRGLLALILAASALLAATVPFTPATATVAPYTVEDGRLLSSAPGVPEASIAYSLFTPSSCLLSPCPAILMTHGWGGNRGNVAHLADAYARAGYVVLTYDARGWAESTGTITLDGPAEVADARNLLTLLAQTPAVLTDAPGDPRVGMRGVSYAGAIQLLTAQADPRLDTIVPEITWSDLRNALLPNGVLKSGWVDLLFASAQGGEAAPVARTLPGGGSYPFGEGHPDPMLTRWYAEVKTTGPSNATLAAIAERSPSTRMGNVTIPTFLIQGWKDTLFTPNEAIATYQALRARGVDARLLLYDWGHGYDTSADPQFLGSQWDPAINAKVLAWFDRHLKGIPYASGEPARIEASVAGGTVTLDSLAALKRVTLTGFGNTLSTRLVNPVQGGSSTAMPQFQKSTGQHTTYDVPGASASLRLGYVNETTVLLGVPRASVTLSSPTPDVTLFVKVLAEQRGIVQVLGPQVQPVKLHLPAAGAGTYRGTFSFDLVGVTATLEPGANVYIDVSANDLWFAPNTDTTTVYLERASLELPLHRGNLVAWSGTATIEQVEAPAADASSSPSGLDLELP